MYRTKAMEKTAVDGITHLPAEFSMAGSTVLQDEHKALMTRTTATLEKAENTWANLQDSILNFDILRKAEAEQKREVYNRFTYNLDQDADEVFFFLQESKRLIKELRQRVEKLKEQITVLTENYLEFVDMYYGKK